ncbi:MAG TPA: GNAT family N-acetyltransferase [Candidatus Methylomirabilis sp.]|nr:GNAT family N-acetyltransferase [Candidatus Methylomirabilis sp.]
MSDVLFRPAASEDEPVLLRMMRNLAEQEPGAYFFDEPGVREVLRKFLADPGLGQAWVFFDEKTPVGYIVLTFGYSFEYHGRDAFIDELYIDPQYRRKGIGRRAMQFVEQRAREHGVAAIHLEVDDGNDPASELYRHSGYEDHERYLMTKWLVSHKR